MSIILKLLFASVIAFSLFFASWYVLNDDLIFDADIGRDFHLLRELDEKKIVLIGPRSSTGLFHGPLWTYINYPAYLIGNGNPVTVGFGWVVFIALFGLVSFYIGDKLFGRATAYLYSMMATLYAAFHAKGMFNPHGAMFLIPLCFFFFVMYFKNPKAKYLLLHLAALSAIIQFQMADGMPLLALSVPAIMYKIFKTRKFKHIFVYFLLPIFLVNFIVFDLRHEFLLTQKVAEFVTPVAPEGVNVPKTENGIYKYSSQIPGRIDLAFQGTEILRQNRGNANLILFLITLIFIAIQLKDNKFRTVYLSFLYFYIGFFVLSFINKGQILYFYLFPIFPLVLLIFSSFITSRFKKVFLILFLAILVMNIKTAFSDIETANAKMGKDMYSWKFLNETSRKIFEGNEKELGYFIYSPDVFGYEAKYAALYNAEHSGKASHYFQKKPVTYLLIQPPPKDNPYMKEGFWIKHQIRIDSSPSAVINFPNNYKIMKINLKKEEIEAPYDPAINPGLHFR